jgi:hypothetical protein
VEPVEPPVIAKPAPAPIPAPVTEAALKAQLRDVPEFSLPGVDALRASQLKYANTYSPRATKQGKRNWAEEKWIAMDVQDLLRRAGEAGLPVLDRASCTLSPDAAETLGRGAVDLRPTQRMRLTGTASFLTATLVRNPNGNVSVLEKNGRVTATGVGMPRSALLSANELRKLFEETWPAENVETKFDVVPLLVQVLQVENDEYRQLLVEELERIPGTAASKALADRALFDTSPTLRRAARVALKNRPAAEYREAVLKGFAHPWSPVAEHAAEVLVELKDVSAVPELVRVLDRPDPAGPYLNEKTKQQTVRELVRINHMRNCVLCHAPSHDPTDWVSGRVMEPDTPIPDDYYGSRSGAFVRADVTYIRPDFSVMQPVEKAAPWPKVQRFDYVVRTRPATAEEVDRAEKRSTGASYPQRESALAALRGLSGQDLGTSTEDWQRYAAEVRAGMVK